MSRMSRSKRGRRPRQQLSDEFKEGAVRLVLDEGKTVGAVGRELDLTASALSLCVRHARAERTKGKSRLVKEEREELARLRKDLTIARASANLARAVRNRLSHARGAPESVGGSDFRGSYLLTGQGPALARIGRQNRTRISATSGRWSEAISAGRVRGSWTCRTSMFPSK